MLTIFMQDTSPVEAAAPVVSQLSLTELFRTLHVVGEVPFIEPSAGTLLNLTHVERIYDDTVDDEREATGTPADYVPQSCPHGYIRGTCSRCASPAERDEWGTVGP